MKEKIRIDLGLSPRAVKLARIIVKKHHDQTTVSESEKKELSEDTSGLTEACLASFPVVVRLPHPQTSTLSIDFRKDYLL